MKRILSLVLVAAMLICGMVISPATVSAVTPTLDEYNVAAEARYFGGNVTVWQGHGNYNKSITYEDTSEDKYDLRTNAAEKGSLLINGKIDEGEWGDPIVVIDSKYAANNSGYKWYHSNIAFETPSAENTYYFYNTTSGESLTPNGLSYTLWMMWDEDYLYVAAHVDDIDGHLGANPGNGADNQDSLQVRIDPQGPNSVVNGKGYDAKGNDRNDAYDQFIPPWAGTEYPDKRWEPCHDSVGNFVFAYVNASGGYTEMWDAARRYNPELKEDYTDRNENPLPTTFYYGDDASNSWTQLMNGTEGLHAMVCPVNKGTPKNPKWETEYEIAIPWNLIGENYKPTAGDQLGASVSLNDGRAGDAGAGAIAYLEWGTGSADTHMRYSPITCGGSNCLILSGDSYTTPRCAHEFSPATCLLPETCSKCGYVRGYKAAHKYEFSNTKIATPEKNGSVTAKCKICGDTFASSVAAGKDDVIYSFKSTDTEITGKGLQSGWTNAWQTAYDEKDEDGNDIGYIINVNGANKNSYDNTIFKDENGNPIAVADLYSDGSAYANIYPGTNNASHTGTYFDSESAPQTYTYKMDVYFPTLDDITKDAGYSAGIRNWFGSSNKYGFHGAGLYRVEGKWYFAITDNIYGEDEKITTEKFKANVLAWAEATEEDLALNEWHTYAVMIDDVSHTVMFAWDGELKVAATDYHMGAYGTDGKMFVILRRFYTGLYAKDIEVGNVGLFNKYAVAPEVPVVLYNATINGETSKYEAGDVVEVNGSTYVEDGKIFRFNGWTGDTELLQDASSAVAKFTMPARDVTLDAEYIVVGDADGDGKVDAKDSATIKNIILGKAETGDNVSADINGDGKINTKDIYLIKRLLAGVYTPEK